MLKAFQQKSFRVSFLGLLLVLAYLEIELIRACNICSIGRSCPCHEPGFEHGAIGFFITGLIIAAIISLAISLAWEKAYKKNTA